MATIPVRTVGKLNSSDGKFEYKSLVRPRRTTLSSMSEFNSMKTMADLSRGWFEGRVAHELAECDLDAVASSDESDTPPDDDLGLRLRMLVLAGIKLSKDGKSVFNYNPKTYQAFLNFLVALPLLPSSGLFFNAAHLLQLLLLLIFAYLWAIFISDSTAHDIGQRDLDIEKSSAKIAPLTQFVLSLYVSLSLAKTYYANRSMFGVVFGASMGLAQMIVAWVQPPCNIPGTSECASNARQLLIRWINAAFRLMWLESRSDLSTDEIGEDMLSNKLLTEQEWDHILALPSRCSHIYQWINNVLHGLYLKGYLSSYLLGRLNVQVDGMRGANVWGLPSLPFPYTMIITHMVKAHLLLLSFNYGADLKRAYERGHLDTHCWLTFIRIHFELLFNNYFFQGLLDLHGVLYNPNSGTLLGHMPAVNFLDFVRRVSEDLNTCSNGVPYELTLVDAYHPSAPPTARA